MEPIKKKSGLIDLGDDTEFFIPKYSTRLILISETESEFLYSVRAFDENCFKKSR